MEEISDYNGLIESIREIIKDARKRIARNINIELIATYWKIGKTIVENEQRKRIDSKSSRQLILSLSKELTNELGKGFSRANLFNMRKFYLEYPDVQTVSGQLTWSHYSELLIIEDESKRNFYDAGQLNTYLNFYKTEVNDTGDNPPIGIILCAEKDEIGAEYILGGFDNNLFASRFSYVLPDKEEFIKELEMH